MKALHRAIRSRPNQKTSSAKKRLLPQAH